MVRINATGIMGLAVMSFLMVATHPAAYGQINSSETPPAWLPEVEDILTPQDFPTAESAGAAVGALFRQTIGKAIPSADGIAVLSDTRPVAKNILETIGNSLEKEFPEESVRIVESRDEIRDKEICIAVQIDDEEYTLHAKVLFPVQLDIDHGQVALDYDNKPWVTFDEPLDEHSRIVRSERLADSPRDAKQQCLDHALDILAPIFDGHAQRIYKEQHHANAPFDTREAVRKALVNGLFTVDEFSQRLRTREGTDAWRHTMLLTDTAMNSLMVTKNIEVSHRRHARDWRWLGRLGGVLALLGCITVVYLVLDTATKGYYAGRISAAIAVFGLVGLVLIFLRTLG